MSKRFMLLAICLLFCGLAMNAGATILIDENFEGATAFVDQNWATVNETTINTDAFIDSTKGCNLRNFDSGALGTPTAKASPVALTGGASATASITTERHFLGAKSFKLLSGQSLTPLKGSEWNNGTDAYTLRGCHLRQFAISCSTESIASTPVGTRIGYYSSTWTIKNQRCTSTTVDVVDTNYQLNFLVGPDATVDVFCSNTQSKIGAFPAGMGGWGLISSIDNTSITPATPTTPTQYVTYTNYTTDTTVICGYTVSGMKGPKGANQNTGSMMLGPGIHTFVNSDVADNYVTPQVLGTIPTSGVITVDNNYWGNDNVVNAFWNTSDITFTIAAENGATLYIDNLYQDRAWHNFVRVTDHGLAMECGRRVQEFNTISNEPRPLASVGSWALY